ncbi:hypothetical protein CC86DRAFT_459883 [Ophiobolus disseminans]|uniref:Uncharacterized protein n=1 Tax=Ophiobolus disseminans TaxID=1469910 RepID=A0A6A6ZJM9_9PLEO|nr:hypothetical protein CC86DRAFT_459883 [Ophiobolus disseminans]
MSQGEDIVVEVEPNGGVNDDHSVAIDSIQGDERARKEGVALIAGEIIRSNPHLHICLPVVFNQPGYHSSANDFSHLPEKDNTYTSNIVTAPTHFALWIRFPNREDTILSLALDVVGTRSAPLYVQHGAPKQQPWDSTTDPKLGEFFTGFPFLQVADTILLIPTFRATGQLIASADYKSGNPIFQPRVLADT